MSKAKTLTSWSRQCSESGVQLPFSPQYKHIDGAGRSARAEAQGSPEWWTRTDPDADARKLQSQMHWCISEKELPLQLPPHPAHQSSACSLCRCFTTQSTQLCQRPSHATMYSVLQGARGTQSRKDATAEKTTQQEMPLRTALCVITYQGGLLCGTYARQVSKSISLLW